MSTTTRQDVVTLIEAGEEIFSVLKKEELS